MKKLVYISALLLFAGFFIAGCGKYEDGPKLSLKSKTARLSNTWVIETLIIDGVTYPADSVGMQGYVITFSKDGKVAETYGNITMNGTWEFSGDVDVVTTYTVGTVSSSETLEILKLKTDELWLQHVQGTYTTETHLIPQ